MDKLKRCRKINEKTIALGGVIMMLSYFPQMFTILKNRSSQGINLLFLGMVTMALATFTFNGYVVYLETNDKKTLISQLANLIPAIITCILIVIFR